MPCPEGLFAHLIRERVYTRLSIRGASLSSLAGFPSGNVCISGERVAKQLVGCLGNTDAGSTFHLPSMKPVLSDPQRGTGRGEVAAGVADTGDAEGFSQTAGTAGELAEIGGAEVAGVG